MRRFLALALAACSGGNTAKPTPPRPTPVEVPRPRAMTLADTGIVPDWMDRAADPCTDFFAYACGGFLKTAEIPADRARGAAPGFPWDDYLTKLGIPTVTDITVNDPRYYAAIGKMLRTETPAALQHYLVSMVLQNASLNLTKVWSTKRSRSGVDRALGHSILGEPFVGEFAASITWRSCIPRRAVGIV